MNKMFLEVVARCAIPAVDPRNLGREASAPQSFAWGPRALITGWSFMASAMEPWILILPERKADCGLREPDASLAKFSSEVVTVMSIIIMHKSILKRY